jgi:hypothetical protein
MQHLHRTPHRSQQHGLQPALLLLSRLLHHHHQALWCLGWCCQQGLHQARLQLHLLLPSRHCLLRHLLQVLPQLLLQEMMSAPGVLLQLLVRATWLLQ